MSTTWIRSILVCLILAASGCGPAAPQIGTPPTRPRGPIIAARSEASEGSLDGKDIAANSGQDDPDDIDRTPRVSDDPREIAEVRKLHEQERATLYDEAIAEIRGSGILAWRYRKALEAQKLRAVKDLQRMLDDRSATDPTRARAARILFELGDPSGETFLLEAVRTGKGARRAAAFKELDDWGLRRKVDLKPPDRARLVLDGLDDPDPSVVFAAASLCANRKIPGAEEKLVTLIDSGRIKEPGRLALELADVARSPRAFQIIRDELLRDSTAKFDPWTDYHLRPLLQNPDPKLSEPVRAAFLRRTLARMEKERSRQWVVRNLALAADLSAIPVLEDVFAHSRDPVSRAYAAEAMARIDPEHGLDRALELVRAEKRFSLACEVLKRLASPRNADRIIDAFLEVHRREKRGITMVEARLLMDQLGPHGRQVLQESIDDLETDARTWVTWKFKGLTLDAAIDDLRAAGIITKGREAILESMRRAVEPALMPTPFDPSDPGGLQSALSLADVLTAFDTETDEIPCLHHELIMEFAENSRGLFAPECAVQTWHRKDREDIRAPYTVRFIDKGRLYRFGAENLGDWYDVRAVVHALNLTLQTSGRKERYIGLETGGQDASYVFADPAAFRPIAVKYSLPLSDDPDSAMRHGKAFERQVIEKLEGREKP